MTQVKNVKPTHVLEKRNSYEALIDYPPNIYYLQNFTSIVDIIIYKNVKNLNFEKFEVQALNKTLVRYDRYIIYRLFIQK